MSGFVKKACARCRSCGRSTWAVSPSYEAARKWLQPAASASASRERSWS